MSKYLAIKNWEKYQSGKKGWDWIKDYVNQNDDEELSGLSLFERGLLQELRRVRGRSGKNIHNDVTHIARAIHAKVTDRPHLRHAIDTLIARNILVLTNQQDGFLEEKREEEKREEINENPVVVRVPLKVPEPKPDTKEFSADDLTFMVLREIGIPTQNAGLTVLVASAITAKARSPDWTLEKAALHMIERGTAYKSSWVWNSPFKKKWKDWFQDQCYDQDPEAWKQPEGGNRNGKTSKLSGNLQALEDA